MDLAKENDGKKTRIVILGSGFAGIYAALELEKRLAKAHDIDVILIDRQNFFLFTPMLHEVAASDLDINDIVSPIRELLRHSTFLQGDVSNVDLKRRTVTFKHCQEQEESTIHFDHLLLALGAHANFYNLPGVQENAMTMQSLTDALYLRNALIESLEEAEIDAYTATQKPLLTYVVAGGGFAGVETIAAMNDFVRESVRFYPHLKEEMIEVYLVHDGEHVLPELGKELGDYAQKKLTERGVKFLLHKKVSGYGENGVELSDGSALRAVLFVWTAGVTANPLVRTLGAKVERGKVVADQFMQVEGFDNVWACGDCAYIVDPLNGKPYPPTAQHASRMGKVVARNIEAAIRGGHKEAFVYKSQGALAAIGRRAGVANIMGFKFSGFLAWFLWRTIYLGKLPRLEKKVRVALDWALDLLFPKDMVQFMSLQKPLVQNAMIQTTTQSSPMLPEHTEAHAEPAASIH